MVDFLQYWNNAELHSVVGSGFFTLHLDTVIISTITALSMVTFMYLATFVNHNKSVYISVSPSRNLVEFIYESMDSMLSKTSSSIKKFSMAYMTVLYGWMALMNILEILPNSLVAILKIYSGLDPELKYGFKLVATEDINTTLALAVMTLLIVTGLSLYSQGAFKFILHVLTEPFGKFAVPLNILFYMLENATLVFGLAMRLYVNLLTGSVVSLSCGAFKYITGAIVYFCWSFVHTPVLLLQVIIFTEIAKSCLSRI